MAASDYTATKDYSTPEKVQNNYMKLSLVNMKYYKIKRALQSSKVAECSFVVLLGIAWLHILFNTIYLSFKINTLTLCISDLSRKIKVIILGYIYTSMTYAFTRSPHV